MNDTDLGALKGDVPAGAMLKLAAPEGAKLLPGDLAVQKLAKLVTVHLAGYPLPCHCEGERPPSE